MLDCNPASARRKGVLDNGYCWRGFPPRTAGRAGGFSRWGRDRDQAERLLPSRPAAHSVELHLVDDFHAELLRLFQLRPRLVAGEHKVRLLAHAAADLAAERLDLRGRLLARKR